METTLNRQGGGGAGVIAALQDTAVGKEVCRQKAGCLDDVDHLAPIPKSVAKRIEGLVKVMLLVLRQWLRPRDETSPEEDGIHKDRMPLLGPGATQTFP